MNLKHTFVNFVIPLMLAIPVGLQAAPPTNPPADTSLAARVAALEAQITAQQPAIDDLIAENIAQQQEIDDLTLANTALTAKLACVSAASNSTALFFEGCNVHVRNGAGQTDSLDGFGNLIIGYNEDAHSNNRTGSHNLVVGPEHTYSSYGGFVAGFRNSVTGVHASVSGGDSSTAAGSFSSVAGGDGITVNDNHAWAAGSVAENNNGVMVDTNRSFSVDAARDIDMTAGLKQTLRATASMELAATSMEIDGSFVRINGPGQAAARVGDSVVNDEILTGSATVFIGD